MLKSKLQNWLLIGLFLGTSSCGHIKVYNRRVYVDLGIYGSHWAETLTDKTGDVQKEEWDKLRIGMFCMDSQAYTDAETAIDQFCTAYNVCDYQTRESIRAGFLRIRKLNER